MYSARCSCVLIYIGCVIMTTAYTKLHLAELPVYLELPMWYRCSQCVSFHHFDVFKGYGHKMGQYLERTRSYLTSQPLIVGQFCSIVIPSHGFTCSRRCSKHFPASLSEINLLEVGKLVRCTVLVAHVF